MFTIRRALTASLDSCAEIKIECPFSGVTKSGRVGRKVPESDARRVSWLLGSYGEIRPRPGTVTPWN